MTQTVMSSSDPRQYDYASEGPRHSPLWAERYILFLRDVTAVFDGFKALDIENLGIGHHELRVVIGPNGAGKTTMCDVISGMTKPTTAKGGHQSGLRVSVPRRREPGGRQGLQSGMYSGLFSL